jgi:hypothetical protein
MLCDTLVCARSHRPNDFVAVFYEDDRLARRLLDSVRRAQQRPPPPASEDDDVTTTTTAAMNDIASGVCELFTNCVAQHQVRATCVPPHALTRCAQTQFKSFVLHTDVLPLFASLCAPPHSTHVALTAIRWKVRISNMAHTMCG